jgi:tripartite-type tricarboxylate transporter receptor subunit TctC
MNRRNAVPSRLRRVLATLFALGIGGAAFHACAQQYPVKPVQILVSLPAGTGTDILARTMAQVLDAKFGQRFLVVNREGNGVMVAATALASAPPDGYTVAVLPSTIMTVQLHRDRPTVYNRNTFVGVCQTFDNVLFVGVSASSQHKDLPGLLGFAKANPGKVRFGTSGVASAPHLAGAQLFSQAGVQVTDVPYRGETAYLPNLLAGEIDLGAVSANLIATQKGLRPLAVFAKERLKAYPNVPTTAEFGYPVSTLAYFGLWIRSDAPPAVITTLDSACREVVNGPAYTEVAEKQFVRATYLDRRAFNARIDEDSVATEKLLKTLKLAE